MSNALTDIFAEIRQSASLTVGWWRFEAIESLNELPHRCGLARENREFDEPIRQLLFGRRHNAYRIIFVVRDDRALVLRVLHGAREALLPEELKL